MLNSFIRTFLLLLLALLQTPSQVSAQTVRTVDSRDGLASMFVLSVYQDVRGFVWAGTYSGLSILDGNGTSVAFADRPEVWAEAGVMVRSIDGAADGTVWMTTNFGLDCWDMTLGRREHHTEFTGAYRVAVGPRGDVVVLTPDKGYFAYNALQHRFQNLTAELVADRDVHAMSIDSAGLWRVITRTHTLEATLVTEADGRVVALQPRKVPHAMGRLVTAKADADRLLMVDEQGVFYEGDASGRDAREVCRLSPELQRREPYAAILRDGDDYLLGFYSGGVFRLRRTPDGYVEEPTAVTCGIFDIRRDRQQDIIWVATDGEGVCCLAREPYLFYHELYADLPFKVSAPVRAILRDSGGDLWVATKGDGLLCYEGYMPGGNAEVRRLTNGNSALLHDAVYALAQGSQGVMWIGSDGQGINYYNPRSHQLHTLDVTHPQLGSIHALLEVDGRELYACTGGGGVFRIGLEWQGDVPHATRIAQLLHDAENPSTSHFISLARQDSVLWLANRERGLRCLSLYSDSSSLLRPRGDSFSAQNDPIALCYDASGRRLICGMSRGLLVLSQSHGGGTLAVDDIGATIGLPDATVRGLTMDGNFLWAATTQGLVCCNLQTREFSVFTPHDDLRILEFGEGAAYCDDARGEKYFGGTNGFVVVGEPASEAPQHRPPLQFTGLRLGDRYVGLSGDLRLRHNENYLTLSYTAVDYFHSDNYVFQYRRAGVADSAWHDLGHARSITFADLLPGHYRVQVRYQNGHYVSPAGELAFTIRPPWYATPWARLLWVVLIAGAVFGGLRLYRWLRGRRLRRLQHIIEQRRREAALHAEIHQRDEALQQREGELQQRDQRLEQLRAMTAELSPYDVVGDRVLHREDQQLLERIFQIVEQHVDDPELSPNSIADELCMSYRNLYRRMQEISDKTLVTIIRDVRMERACRLLTQTKLTIEQVALQVGYQNRGSFYKHFTSRFGCTPRQFHLNFTAEVVPSAADNVQSTDKVNNDADQSMAPSEEKE